VVRTGTATAENVRLRVGSSGGNGRSENADELQVNTEQAGVSDVISKQQIDSLLVNGRNFLDLAQIEPGVILQSGESFDPIKGWLFRHFHERRLRPDDSYSSDGQDIKDENVGTTIFNVSQGAIGRLSTEPLNTRCVGRCYIHGPGAGFDETRERIDIMDKPSINFRITALCSQGQPRS